MSNFSDHLDKHDVREVLKKVPARHRQLLQTYQLILQKGGTLKGDRQHIGRMEPKTQQITLASPWHFSRSMALLHELGHLVWTHILTKSQRQHWQQVLKQHPPRNKKDTPEELFAMAYANRYVQHPVLTYANPAWRHFLDQVFNSPS